MRSGLTVTPDGRDGLRGWYVDAARRCAATVSEPDRDGPCRTFGRPLERVWFWIRRQALDAAVLLLLAWRRVQVDDQRVHLSHDAVTGEWELTRSAP